jgi:hypothetical protein
VSDPPLPAEPLPAEPPVSDPPAPEEPVVGEPALPDEPPLPDEAPVLVADDSPLPELVTPRPLVAGSTVQAASTAIVKSAAVDKYLSSLLCITTSR